MTPEELKTLISKYGDTDKLAQSGVTIAGTRYMYLSSTDRVVRAKKGTNGVHAIKTQQSKQLVTLESTFRLADWSASNAIFLFYFFYLGGL